MDPRGPRCVRAAPSTLAAALRAGVVPSDLAGRAVRGGRDAEGVVVEVDAALAAALIDAGFVPADGPSPRASFPCWPALLPATSAPLPETLAEVLFVLPPGIAWGALGGELWRLGCDTQSIARVSTPRGPRDLVRALQPPWYVTLRHLDDPSLGRCFAPLDPRPDPPGDRGGTVYVELGRRHPLAAWARAAPDTLTLIGEAGFETLPDGPWRPLDQLTDLAAPETLPSVAITPPRLQVTLHLGAESVAPPPTLWVLRPPAVDRLERWLSHVPDAVAARLRLAAFGPRDAPTLVLHAVPGAPPPTLALDAEGYAAVDGLPRLHRPPGRRVAPPLRPDRLRARLAPDADRVYWLAPVDAPGGFRVESLPAGAFAPLSAWIDHLVAGDEETLDAWVASVRFELDDLITEVEAPAAAPTPPPTAPPTPRPRPAPAAPKRPAPRPAPPLLDAPPAPAPDAARVALDAATDAFRADPTPLDHPDRVAAWARLATLHAAAGRPADAALCWARALWTAPPAERAALGRRWAEAAGPPPTLTDDAPPEAVRAVAASLIAGAGAEPRAAAARFLERHEDTLDLRTRWLARRALAQGDRLMLLRARDAVLARLRDGLPARSDLPGFVRRAGRGEAAAGPLTEALEQLEQIVRATPRARSPLERDDAPTVAYLDRIYAWAHARLGRREDAEHRAARAPLPADDPVHAWAARAFAARLEDALDGRPATVPLPATLEAERAALERFDRYKVDRLREASWILAPGGPEDAFATFRDGGDDPTRAAMALPDAGARAAAADAARERLQQAPSPEAARAVVALLGTLGRAEAAAGLEDALSVTDRLPPDARAAFVADAARLAEHLERPATLGRALRALRDAPPAALPAAAAALADVAPAARRAELSSEVEALAAALTVRLDEADDDHWIARLRLAEARAAIGDEAALRPALEAAAARLPRVEVPARLRLQRALALSLGRTDPERAAATVLRLAPSVADVTDHFSTNSHFALSLLQFVESLVLALCRDGLALDPWARRFVEADEHLLRHRLHLDLTTGAPA